MAPRTRRNLAPVPDPEPETTETEEQGAKRGPSVLTLAHVQWLKAEYDVDADPEVVYLAQTTRREFRQSDLYQKTMEQIDAEKEAAAAVKAKRIADREAAQEDDAEEAPKATGRRARKAAAPAPAEAEAPAAEAAPTRRRRAAKATAEAAPAETAEAAPVKRTRKTANPF